ncbi:hypothetical protein ACFLTE_08890 [Bacteroidota bacterium]
MKYLVDISQKHAQKIQKLVGQGDYEGIAQFINVAIENQLYLEESGLPTFTEDKKITNGEFQTDNNADVQNTKGINCLKLTTIQANPQFVSSPSYMQLVLGQQEGKEEMFWPWGQINKILPIKIGVRTLFRELKTNDRILLDDFAKKAVKEAAYIGQVIRLHEDKLRKLRGERISAGLPKVDDEKSQTRYKAQFLAYGRKDGLLDGAMALFRFANIEVSNGKHMIGLTQAGIDFAKIPNPVLDENNLDKSLDQEEIDFYMAHARSNVKSEFAGIKWILTKIHQGINERESLNSELKKEFAKLWDASDAVINTQRAGLMARMFELSLFDKEKKGIYVTYHLNDFAKSFLNHIIK